MFRDPGAGDSGGSTPTLASLVDGADDGGSNWVGNANTGEPIIPPTPAVEPANEPKLPEATPPVETPEQLAARELAELAAADAAAEGEADGEGDLEGESDPADEEETPEAFYTNVDQITGETVTVEYGDVDPLAPEGVALREQAIRQDAVIKFEEYLKTTDPRSFAYLAHRRAGGSDDAFMERKSYALPDAVTFQDSVQMQSDVYRNSLVNAGVPTDIADTVIAAAIKDNSLYNKAAAAYNKIAEDDQRQLAAVEARIAEEEARFAATCNTVITQINTQVDTGLKFLIPESKKGAFKSFLNDSLRHEDGKFMIVQELGDDPKALLEAMYFKFIGGDLNSLVEKRAETKAVQRMKLGVNRSKSALAKGSEGRKPASGFVPLGSIS